MSSIALGLEVIDQACAIALNSLVQAMPALSRAAAFTAGADTLKTLPFTIMIVAAWHRLPLEAGRQLLLRGMAGVLLAMVLGRFLPFILPFRARPLYDPALDLATPPGVSEGAMDGWTSFPSDHGMLFGALLALAFALGRRQGWAAVGFVVIAVWLPRLLLGYHFVSDIAVGVVLGMACVWAAIHLPQTACGARLALRWAAGRPALFYTLATLALMQQAQMFVPLRGALAIARSMVR